ncbi:MAG: hypothetical protein KBT01_01585 [Clostridiales bacterium]|nr:hypothetical protein [Candidatus Blautia equi]
MFFTVIGAFVLYFVTDGAIGAGSTGGLLSYATFTVDHYLFGTYYISMSILFAYSVTYGEEMILFMFVIPLKMKWLGIAYGAMIAYEIVSYLSKPNMWYFAIPIIASLLNFVVFYFGTGKMHRYNPKEVVRKQKYKKAVSEGQAKAARLSKHKCAVCGRTEQDDPNLEFRFCSRCNGNYEYCNDHLFTHTHVQ